MEKNSSGTVSLLFFAVLALIIGWASVSAESGTATASITEVTEVNFTTDSIDWGTGSVIAGSASCILDSSNSGTTGCTGFTGTSAGLTLENIGSEDVQLNVSSSTAADALVGGSSPSFMWKITNSTASCPGSAWGLSSYTEITTTAVDVCTQMDATDASDDVTVHFKLTIPSDTTQSGSRSATITATATEVVD